MLRKMKEISLENENNDDDQEDDKNEICDKANCKIDEASGDEILWLKRGKRYQWFHTICISLTSRICIGRLSFYMRQFHT